MTNKRLWHGTLQPVTKIRPLMHLGSQQAALDRLTVASLRCLRGNATDVADPRPHLVEVEVNAARPLRIEDHGLEHGARGLFYAVADAGLFDRKRAARMTPEVLCSLLRRHGYDSLEYVNAVEDEGSTSLVALSEDQIHVVRRVEYDGLLDEVQRVIQSVELPSLATIAAEFPVSAFDRYEIDGLKDIRFEWEQENVPFERWLTENWIPSVYSDAVDVVRYMAVDSNYPASLKEDFNASAAVRALISPFVPFGEPYELSEWIQERAGQMDTSPKVSA